MKLAAFKTCLALTLAAVFAGSSPSLAGTNLLANPGFEDGGGSYAGWTTFGQGGVQLSSASGDSIVRSGVEASKIFGEFTGCPIPTFDVTLYLQSFVPTPGMDYEFSGWSYVSSIDAIPGTTTCTSNRCIAKISFFDSAVLGNEISSNEVVIGDWNSTTDQWNEFLVSAPAPAGAQRVEVLIIYLQPGCDAGSVFVDDLSFCEVTPPGPVPGNLLVNASFDSDLSVGWTAFGNALWENRGNTIPQFAFARRTPAGSAKLFSSFLVGDDSGMYQGFAASPGSEWELGVYSLTSCIEDPIDGTSDSYATAKIVFLDGGFPPNEISSVEKVLVDASSPQGSWTKHRLVAIAPTGTVTVRAYFLFISPSLLPGDACFLDDASFRSTTITDVAAVPRPVDFELRQNVPNPFGLSTRIDFVLLREDAVDLSVYDVAGRRVTTLLDGPVGPGTHSLTWDGTRSNGAPAAAGVYQYVLTTSTGRTARSLLRIK